MNLMQALVFLQDNYKDDSEILMLGVTYENNSFIGLQLNYSNDPDEYTFSMTLFGGEIASSEGIEDSYFADSIEGLITEIPTEFHKLNYKVYEMVDGIDTSSYSEVFLAEIFPELIKLNEELENNMEFDVKKYIKAAKILIDELNTKPIACS